MTGVAVAMNFFAKFKNGFVPFVLILFSQAVFAATYSLSGNARFGSNMYNNLDLTAGTSPGEGNTAAYLESRFLVRPDIVVDDRFSVKSEWILQQRSNDAGTSVPEGFGTALGDRDAHAYFLIRRAWLHWASDWGVFSFGRQPKAWGLGLLHHPGSDPYDDFATTVDRAGFQGMLGNLIVGIAYEKESEKNLNNEGDDADVYELSLEYSNPETLFDVGLMYTRNARASSSETLRGSSHDLSIYSKKRWNAFQLGAELASIAEEGKSNALGVLAQLDYMPGLVKFNFDLAYAGASNNSAFIFHPNYRPLVILFRQSLAAQKPAVVRGGAEGASSALGSNVAGGTGSGALLAKVGASYSLSNGTYVVGGDLGYAKLTHQGTSSSAGLGTELDLHLTQKWYENFSTNYALGVLFPGKAFVAQPKMAWGFQIRGALAF
jgi:hypothetical protein